MRSFDDVKSWFSQLNIGTVETAASPFWRLLPHYVPHVKIITIRRPVNDVITSLVNLGFDKTPELIKAITVYDQKLNQIEKRLDNVLSIKFDDLKYEHVCAGLLEHATGQRHDHDRWQMMDKYNLQVDMTTVLRYVTAYHTQLAKFAAVAKSTTISLMKPKTLEADDGVTFQEESWAQLYQDGKELFAEHLIDVGEHPDGYDDKNTDIIQKLDEVGALQIITARQNGRIFGYLMAVISPSLEYNDGLLGVHTLFYTSKHIKNIGMRLQRASVAALKQKGIKEVILRAGVRGSTAGKIATLYKRLGAEDFGHLYRIDLGA